MGKGLQSGYKREITQLKRTLHSFVRRADDCRLSRAGATSAERPAGVVIERLNARGRLSYLPTNPTDASTRVRLESSDEWRQSGL